jgi:anti-sigma factor RsiW
MDDYLKGKLDGEVQSELQEHLLACTKCQANLLVIKSLKEMANEEVSRYTENPFFASRVLSRIEAQKVSKLIDTKTRLIGYATIAAAVIIAIFVGSQLGALGSKVISTNTDAEMLAEEYIPSSKETIYEYDFEEVENLNNK